MNDGEVFKRLSRTGVFFLIGYGVFLLACSIIGNPVMLIIGSLSILSAFLVLAFQPRMRRNVQRRQEIRQAAIAGDTTIASLAFPQPVPDEHALPLPSIIKLRPKVSTMAIFAGCFTLFWMALILGVGFFMQGISGMFTTISQSIGSSLFILVLFPFFFVFILSLFAVRQQIQVTSKGLKVRDARSNSSIRWDDVKLFSLQRSKKRAPIIFYELSTSANVLSHGVLLQRLQRNAPIQFYKPVTSFDDYDRQMEALLSLIAAKTGLPLYDLR